MEETKYFGSRVCLDMFIQGLIRLQHSEICLVLRAEIRGYIYLYTSLLIAQSAQYWPNVCMAFRVGEGFVPCCNLSIHGLHDNAVMFDHPPALLMVYPRLNPGSPAPMWYAIKISHCIGIGTGSLDEMPIGQSLR